MRVIAVEVAAPVGEGAYDRWEKRARAAGPVDRPFLQFNIEQAQREAAAAERRKGDFLSVPAAVKDRLARRGGREVEVHAYRRSSWISLTSPVSDQASSFRCSGASPAHDHARVGTPDGDLSQPPSSALFPLISPTRSNGR